MWSRRRALPALLVLALGACARAAPPAPAPGPSAAPGAPPPAPVTPPPVVAAPPNPDAVAPDAVAESLLVDVARVDSTLLVELRYATPYNFMGEVLPGYGA